MSHEPPGARGDIMRQRPAGGLPLAVYNLSHSVRTCRRTWHRMDAPYILLRPLAHPSPVKLMKPATKTLTVSVAAMGILAGSAVASAQSTGVPPFFAFMAQQPRSQAAPPGLPWLPRPAPTARPRSGFVPPWMQPAAARGPFGTPMPGASPFGHGPGNGGWGMPGMSSGLGMMTAPMMQGMAGIMAPFAVNYMVASMNPTTFGNFFGLMTRPGGFGMGGFNPMGMLGKPWGGMGMSQPAAVFPYAQPRRQAPATVFPFFRPSPPPRQARPASPFPWSGSRTAPAKPAQRQRSQSPPRAPFPFPPFSIVGR